MIGASSTIAGAVIQQQLSNQSSDIVAVSRQTQPTDPDSSGPRVLWFSSDYSEANIKTLCDRFQQAGYQLSRVYIFNGILHNDTLFPEKRLADISAEALQAIWQVNALTPLLWLKHLLPNLKTSDDCQVAILSARIGSIKDNQLGGWYAYRMAKAALNMGVKTAAIEYARVAKGVRFLLFHPGTTDTPLSRPFQKNVPPNKLFTPEFVAECLEAVLLQLPLHEQGNLVYRDWQGADIDW